MELIGREALPKKSLGETLMEAKLITQEQWQHVFEARNREGKAIEQILLDEQLVTPQQLAFFTSLCRYIPFVNLNKQSVNPKAVELVPESVARKYRVVPI